jgi:vancomycin permeability regulator SanA
VVLGYELKNGEMQPELKGRCAAAAAAARSFPSTIIICSGGATGDNNPSKHTEAGMMRDYLVKRCGIEASRIHIDESAMTTLENASNTIEMLQQQGIETMTIVTSTYHQRWGQAVYNAVAVLYRRYFGYSVTIEYNYCFYTEPEHEIYRNDDRLAIRQIAQLLNVPMERQ